MICLWSCDGLDVMIYLCIWLNSGVHEKSFPWKSIWARILFSVLDNYCAEGKELKKLAKAPDCSANLPKIADIYEKDHWSRAGLIKSHCIMAQLHTCIQAGWSRAAAILCQTNWPAWSDMTSKKITCPTVAVTCPRQSLISVPWIKSVIGIDKFGMNW